MEKFINKYEYTDDVITEAMTAYWSMKNGGHHGRDAIIISMFSVVAALLNQWIFSAFFIVGLFVFIIISDYKRRKIIFNEIQRKKDFNPNEDLVIEVTVAADIHLKSGETERIASFEDIADFVESKNLIVLLFKNDATLTLHKGNFVEGNANDCLVYICDKIGKSA